MSYEDRIAAMLSAWGRWAIKSMSGGIGYPSVSPMFRDYRSSDIWASREPTGVSIDMELVTKSVDMLPKIHKCCVIEVYQFSPSKTKACSRLGISRPSLNKYLTEAHRMVSTNMDAIANKNI